MEWTRSETVGLASPQCTTCHGLGLRMARKGKEIPCHCVMRAIFRACFHRFRQCVEKEKHLSQCTFQFTGGREKTMSWGRKNEEYIADFLLMAKRNLDDAEYRIFRFHHLLGADWRLCCMKLKVDKGDFFHCVYRIEARLGRVFREEQPYGLFPLDEYFQNVATTPVAPCKLRREGPLPLRPPIAA